MKKSERNFRIYTLLLTVGLFTLISCDFVFQSTENEIEGQNENIAMYKDEARLLVETSVLNLTIVNLSKMEKENGFNPEVKAMADTLKKEHMKISEHLEKVAEDKFISIPDTIYDMRIAPIVDAEQPISDELYLEQVSLLLKDQITSLEQLTERTTDNDFRAISIETKAIVEDQLKNARRLLERP